ncbi:MAG: hypothetical protein M5U16_07910 [Hyphomicrobium sp.]|nr:hypothetical protein [Hyphomicrobium sp.]
MKQALALYHVAFENLGSFESVLSDEGYAISYRNAVHGLAGLDAKGPDLLVVLGGRLVSTRPTSIPFSMRNASSSPSASTQGFQRSASALARN